MIKAALDDVCSIQSGGTPSRDTEPYWGGSIPWAKISDLEASGDGYISDTEEHISEEGLEAIRGRIFDDGTLLFAMYGSVGKAAVVKGSVSTNQAILGIKPDASRLDLNYLKFWLRSQQPKFDQDAQGVAQKNLSAGYVRSLEIPLPPMPEQKRIAAILDKADAIRRKRQQAIQLADDFLRAVFLDMFGDPVSNPKGLAVKSIGDLCDVGTGATPSRAVSEYYGGGIPWVKTTEVDGYVISGTEESISNEGLRNSSCKLNPVGSIVLAMYGQGKTRGKVGVLGVEAATNQACAVIRPSSKVLMQYLYVYLQLSYEALRSLGQGAGQPNLNLSMVKGFPVLMPSHDEQERFVKIVSSVDSYRDEVACGIRGCAELFDSISQKAFLGQV